MILFLDDSAARAAKAYEWMTPEERECTIWCKTTEEAIVTLWDYRDKLEFAMLDHDLGGETYVNTKREDCGMEVVRYLEKLSGDEPIEFKKLQSIKFLVHTWNSHAGPIMVNRMNAIGLRSMWKPFGT